MLKQVHEALGQLLQGQPVTSRSFGPVPSQPSRSTGSTVHHEDVPFEVPVIKRGQKNCRFFLQGSSIPLRHTEGT